VALTACLCRGGLEEAGHAAGAVTVLLNPDNEHFCTALTDPTEGQGDDDFAAVEQAIGHLQRVRDHLRRMQP
jgi:hypothetical protein